MAAGGFEEVQTCDCSLGEQRENEFFNVTLWLKVHHFSRQDNSFAGVSA